MSCIPSAVSPLVHSEGLAERMGDMVLSCSNGTSGVMVTGNLTVFLTVNVTNKLLANNTVDAQLSIDTGSGPVPSPVAPLPYGTNGVVFNGMSFTIPPSGQAVLTITNLRGDANQAATPGETIMALVSFNPGTGLAIANNQFTVAIPQPGLLTESSSSAVTCTGSPLPSTMTLANLLAQKTSFFSTRMTEGFATSFQPKDVFSDTGTRLMLRYSGFPAGVRLFVPDFVAGSSAVQPTAGGDLGIPASGGQWEPSANGSLLLIRVNGADATGAGGTLAFPAPAVPTAFATASEVALTNGSGAVVYEVVDANPSVRESAQFPTFVGVPPTGGGKTIVASAQLTFAPLSSVALVASAPVPRFADVGPPSDCASLGDCNASYFPHLFVDSPPLDFTSAPGGAFQRAGVRVLNNGAGAMNWTATVTYQTGSGWLAVNPASDTNNATLFVYITPGTLAAGTYQATITVDAGPLVGSKTLPVSLTIASAAASGPAIGSVVNAASLKAGPLVAGSLATIFGSGLAGSNVSVTFDNVAAKLLYTGATQINLQVPAAIAGKTSSQMMVMVDGQSATQTVALALSAPAIFSPGILNQDNTVNSAAHPAALGSVIQIFGTGLVSPGSGAISARINHLAITSLDYGGPAPGIPGVQQVNLKIPADLGTTAASVEICAAGADPSQPVCSAPMPVALE